MQVKKERVAKQVCVCVCVCVCLRTCMHVANYVTLANLSDYIQSLQTLRHDGY